MRILFIANLVPYPLDGGGKIKTFTSLQALAQENTVDLLTFYEHENISDARNKLGHICSHVELLPIKVTSRENKAYLTYQALKCLFTGKSLSIYKYYKKSMVEKIKEYLAKYDYDIVYFNYLHIYSYSSVVKSIDPTLKLVLDTQNCESLIFTRYAKESKNLIKKAYLKLEALRLSKFEKWAVEDCDKLIFLSNEDKKELQKLSGHELPGDIIPIGVNEPKVIKKTRNLTKDDTLNILFLGTLTWAPNNEGIIWFLENVMPKLSQKIKVHLFIVGKNPSDHVIKLSEKNSNIEVTGYVDSVDPYYEKSDFCIVPLFIGSGQRVKIIEAFSRGMPVISTSIGAEGLVYEDGKSILIADDADSFIESIKSMSDNSLRENISRNCRKIYERYYSVSAVGKLLRSSINGVCFTSKEWEMIK